MAEHHFPFSPIPFGEFLEHNHVMINGEKVIHCHMAVISEDRIEVVLFTETSEEKFQEEIAAL